MRLPIATAPAVPAPSAGEPPRPLPGRATPAAARLPQLLARPCPTSVRAAAPTPGRVLGPPQLLLNQG